jgi:hypothetical protein
MYQLDIFADSVPVQCANDLIAALLNFDSAASRLALRKLAAADPHHAGLREYKVLCDFIDSRVNSSDAPNRLGTLAAVAAEEQLIREQIVPVAVVMGKSGDDLVRKYWGILAKASEGAGIGPEHGDYFAAELYLRAQQFSDVVRAAQKIPGAEMRASAQRWLGLGFYGDGEIDQARQAALRYAWLAPQRFDSFVDETGNVELARDWSDFQADLGDLDATWFPAWSAHEKEYGISMRNNLPTSDGGMAYRLVTSLAIRERSGLGPAVYEDRARLRQLDKSFFTFYMKSRSDLSQKT